MKLINPDRTRYTNNLNRLGLAALVIVASSVAWGEDEPGWYGGASIGQSRSRIEGAWISQNVLGAGETSISTNDDNRDLAYKFFGGYQFSRHFALEGGYFNLGEFGFTTTTLPPGSLKGNLKFQGVDLDLVGIYPFTQKFSAFGRIGIDYVEAKDSFSGTGSVTVLNPHPHGWDANYKLGVGLQYALTPALGIRTELERYRVNDVAGDHGDIDSLTVGLVYRFGTKSPRVVSQVPAAPVAVAPVLIVVPVAAKTAQYCSILDIQYEINQDEIQREEKEKLSIVGTFLTKYPDTSGMIEGYADSVGSNDANMKLSQRRAETVVSYLVDNFHIAPSRLKAVGYGEARPLASNDTQEGKRMNRRIDAVIACATDMAGLEPVLAGLRWRWRWSLIPTRRMSGRSITTSCSRCPGS